jgi:DNA-binding MarR family transcriptional regulator
LKNKRLKDNIKANYTKIDNRIYKLGLSSNGLALYCFIRSLPEEFDPGVGFIADTLKMSRPTAIKALKELEARNVIKKYQKGGLGRFSKYMFMLPKEWK